MLKKCTTIYHTSIHLDNHFYHNIICISQKHVKLDCNSVYSSHKHPLKLQAMDTSNSMCCIYKQEHFLLEGLYRQYSAVYCKQYTLHPKHCCIMCFYTVSNLVKMFSIQLLLYAFTTISTIQPNSIQLQCQVTLQTSFQTVHLSSQTTCMFNHQSQQNVKLQSSY